MLHAMTADTKSKTQAGGTRSIPQTTYMRDTDFASRTSQVLGSAGRVRGQAPDLKRSQMLRTLQRAIGNQATLRMLEQQIRNPIAELGAANQSKPPHMQKNFAVPSGGTLQTKLVVGPADDPLEREADQVADRVMRMPDPELSITAVPQRVSRKCAACEEEETKNLQTKPVPPNESAVSEVPPIVHEVLRSPGQALDPEVRSFFESRFGYDFSHVQIHTDDKTDASAQSVSALAYTVGSHIAFSSTQYSPHTTGGRQLLAHELVHVIQQSNGSERELVRQPAPKLPPQSAGPSLRVIPGGAGRTAADAAAELAEREAVQTIERAGWREFWKVVAERFAVREGTAAALALADGPLPIGDLIALGLELWIIWDIIDLWDELWAEANSRVQPTTGPSSSSGPVPQPQSEPSRQVNEDNDCKKANPTFTNCEGLSDVYEVVQDYLLNNTNYSFNAIGECREVKDLEFGPNVIDACDGAPGKVYHCNLKGIKDYISVFGCNCCDEDGLSGMDWRSPHINGP